MPVGNAVFSNMKLLTLILYLCVLFVALFFWENDVVSLRKKEIKSQYIRKKQKRCSFTYFEFEMIILNDVVHKKPHCCG